METKEQPLRLEPLPLAAARDLIGEWEMRWWEAVHTASITPDDDKDHGDLTDPSDVVRVATQWCGRAFSQRMVGFFATNLTGLRLALDQLVAEQYRQLEDRVGVLEAMVRGAMDSADDSPPSVRAEIQALKDQADRIEAMIRSLGPASP